MTGKKLPLHDWHQANAARFIDAAGWSVPEAYGKPEIEYAALRNGTGIVDLCHEARYRIEGADGPAFLNSLLTINVDKVPVRFASHCYMCNHRGGIIDSLVLYRDENYFLLLGSGAARLDVLDWMQAESQKMERAVIYVTDVSTAQGQVALRGPGAGTLLERIAGQRLPLDSGHGVVATIGNARTLVIRRPQGTADGFDLIVGSVYLQQLWEKITDAARAAGARPIGHAAREIFRVESGIPRQGLEIDSDITPLELNHGELIDFEKKVFNGRRALLHSTSSEFSRSLVALRTEMSQPLEPGQDVIFDTMPIGRVTSVVSSPMLRCKLALGLVNSMKAIPGTPVKVATREGNLIAAEVLKPGAIPTR